MSIWRRRPTVEAPPELPEPPAEPDLEPEPAEEAPPAPVGPAVAIVMRDEFENLPFGGYAGEIAAPSQGLPPPQPGPPLEIEPPPWAGVHAPVDPAIFNLPAPPVDLGAAALAEMKAGDPDYEPAPWRPFAPPMQPLLRPRIPEVDWREEERLRLDEPAKSLQSRPA